MSAVAGYRPGDRVTVVPLDTYPIILQMQRYATVVREQDGGYVVRLDATVPAGQLFGPIPAERLQDGWRDPRTGEWRRW